jgi:hypothetical protein
MNRVTVWLACSGAALLAAALGCNAILGIGAASLDSSDGGTGVEASRGLSCDYYCATVVQNCPQPFAEYVGSNNDPMSVCETVCPAIDPGFSIGAGTGDTLGCRIFYAEQAATDPATNCRKAGPLGGGACASDPCRLFCELDVQYCNNPPVSAPQYDGGTDCLSDCRDGGYPYLLDPPQDSGCPGYDLLDCTNTLNCRFYHLENAYGSKDNGVFHCPHTAQQSQVCN